MEDRYTDPRLHSDEKETELSLRPQKLDDFIGQGELRQKLKVYIQAAGQRQEPIDHTLFYGPPGLGKTTLAFIMAHEMGVNIKISSGPVLTKPGDLAAILTNLESHDILFVDEIHRLNRSVEEILYSAMEDFELDIIIGKGRQIMQGVPMFRHSCAASSLESIPPEPMPFPFFQDQTRIL